MSFRPIDANGNGGLFRRTRCPGRVPLLQKLHQLSDGIGRRLPPGSGRPAPMDQWLMLDVLDYLSNGAIAIARRVLDLRADIGARLAEPLHRDGRQRPFLSARRAMRQLRVLEGMTGAAG